ncbi:phosphoribosylanthranilate isomerase [Algoriphagus namhaensis]
MALRTFVKVNSINNLSDARYCAGMYVNLLGFQLSPQAEKSIDAQTFKEITGWLSGVEFVAEFHSEPLEQVEDILADFEVKWVEHSQLDVLQALRQSGYQCIYKQDITHVKSVKLELAEELKKNQIHLHLTSNHDELSEREWDIIKALAAKVDVILGSGITAENITSVLSEYPIKGIALNGGDEIKPGLKDFDELADILEEIEVED